MQQVGQTINIQAPLGIDNQFLANKNKINSNRKEVSGNNSSDRSDDDDDESISEESKVFKKKKILISPSDVPKTSDQKSNGSSSPISSTSSDQKGKNSSSEVSDDGPKTELLANKIEEHPVSPSQTITPALATRQQDLQTDPIAKNVVKNYEPVSVSDIQKDALEASPSVPTNVWSQPQVHTLFPNEEKKESELNHSQQPQDEVDEDDIIYEDEQQMTSLTNFVVENSPKGRFKRFGEELGRGAYKIVYKGVDNETGCEIAWNVINLNRLQNKERQRIKSEIDLIKKLTHKNIIHFITAWYNKEKEQVVFITEMITGGSLRKYVKKIKNPRLKVIKGWCKEILQGLVYLHEQRPHPIIHRDLKCDNIFINTYNGEIRIGDLGLSTPMQKSYTTSVLGTPEFMAPELYEEYYGTGVDVYAFGMCVLEMITLERPYMECQNPAQIYNKVINGVYPKALDRIYDEEVRQFILQCLCKAEKRPSAQELLNSKFINDTESEKNNHEVMLINNSSTSKKPANQNIRQAFDSAIPEQEDEDESEGHRTLLGAPGYTQAAHQIASQAIIEDQSQQEPADQEVKIIELQQKALDHAPSIMLSQQTDDTKILSTQQQTDNSILNDQSKPQSLDKENDIKESTMTNAQEIRPSINQDPSAASEQLQKDQQQIAVSTDQSMSSYSNLRSRGNELARKKQKQKKLNESLHFLNMKDEEKQRKLERKSKAAAIAGRVNRSPSDETVADQSTKRGCDEDQEDSQRDIQAKEGMISAADNNININVELQQQQKSPRENSLNETASPQGDILDELKQDISQEDEQRKKKTGINSGVETIETQNRSSQIIQNSKNQPSKELPKESQSPAIAQTPLKITSSNQQVLKSNFSEDGQVYNQPEKKNKIDIKKQFEEDKQGYQSQQSQKSNQDSVLRQQQQMQPQASSSKKQAAPVTTPSSIKPTQTLQQPQVQNSINSQEDFRRASTVPENALQLLEGANKQSNVNTTPSQDDKHKSLFTQAKQTEQSIDGATQKQNVQKKIKDNQGTPNSEEFDQQTSSSVSSKSNKSGSDHNKSVDRQREDLQNNATTPLSSGNSGDNQGGVEFSDSPVNKTKGQQAIINQLNEQLKSDNNARSSLQTTSLNSKNIIQIPQEKQKQQIQKVKSQHLLSEQKPTIIDKSKQQQATQQQMQTIQGKKKDEQTKITAPSSQKIKMEAKVVNKIGEVREVIFEFDANNDTPQSVAREMVNELELYDDQIQTIIKQIESQVSKNKSQPYSVSNDAKLVKMNLLQIQLNKSSALQKPQQVPQGDSKVITIVNHPNNQIANHQNNNFEPNTVIKKQQPTLGVQDQQKNVSLAKFANTSLLVSKERVKAKFELLFSTIEGFFAKMKELKFDHTDTIADFLEESPEENAAYRHFLASVLASKREFKKEIENAREMKNKKLQQQQIIMKNQYHDSPEQQQQQKEGQNLPNVIPVMGSYEQGSQKKNNQLVNIQQHQIHQQIPTQQMKAAGSQKVATFNVPNQIRENFKNFPQQIQCKQKLSKVLKKRDNHEDQQPAESLWDDEVAMLQNVLNLLSSSSKLKHYKTSGKSEQEFQQMLQTHTPLKVDGIFEEKTEACVIKFQKHKQYKPENGIVEDSLWQIMLIDADAISNLTTGTTNHNPDETKKAKTQVTNNIPPQNSANKDSSQTQSTQQQQQPTQKIQQSSNTGSSKQQKQVQQNYKPSSSPTKNIKSQDAAVTYKNVIDEFAKNQVTLLSQPDDTEKQV